MKKRRLKSINVAFISDSVTAEDIEKLPQIKEIIFEELYNSIKLASKTKKRSVSLFEINNSGFVLELAKEYWVSSLERAIPYYEKIEAFEKCFLIKKLIESIYGQRDKQSNTSNRKHLKRKNTNKTSKENVSVEE